MFCIPTEEDLSRSLVIIMVKTKMDWFDDFFGIGCMILMVCLLAYIFISAGIDNHNSSIRCVEAGYDYSSARIGEGPNCFNYTTSERVARGLTAKVKE